jgi:predicted RNA-binding protein
MCEANAILLKSGGEELLMETVALVRVESDEIILQNAFGEQKRVAGRLVELDLEENRIVIEAFDS